MLRPLTQKYLVVIKISCSFPMLGVRSLIWKGEVGGWSKRCAGRRTGERRWRLELRKKWRLELGKKKNSWGLVVIFRFLRVLFVKKDVLCFCSLLYDTFLSRKKKKIKRSKRRYSQCCQILTGHLYHPLHGR